MRMIGSDPDIETLVGRIEREELDLQPDFQRGEVWSEGKRQRLIDSILRKWHVPPIHVLEIPGGPEEVLDGQQRLAAIRDFVRGRIRIRGDIEPSDPELRPLHGFKFSELPPEFRQRFNRFTIRVFTLTDYSPGEPAELFYRLNQPTGLTAAEQRNAFVGPAREQVRKLVAHLGSAGIDKSFVGFSNARMAYDDVLARLCVATARGTIFEKVTAGDLADVYRSGVPFSPSTIDRVERAIDIFARTRPLITPLRLNKASLFSWLWFLIAGVTWDVKSLGPKAFSHFLAIFESLREAHESDVSLELLEGGRENRRAALSALLATFEDRVTSRVSDVSSVVGRDIVLWTFYYLLSAKTVAGMPETRQARIREFLASAETEPGSVDREVELIASARVWGSL